MIQKTNPWNRDKNSWLLERRKRRWLQNVSKKYYMEFQDTKLIERRKKINKILNK